MVCPVCGKELADGTQFCPGCGASISSPSTQIPSVAVPASDSGNNHIKKWLMISGAVLLGIALIVGVYFGVSALIGEKESSDSGSATTEEGEKGGESGGGVLSDVKNIDDAYEYALSQVDFKNKGLTEIKAQNDSATGEKLYSFTFVDKDSYFMDGSSGYLKNTTISFNEKGEKSTENYQTYVGEEKYKTFVGDYDHSKHTIESVLTAAKEAFAASGYSLGETYIIEFQDGIYDGEDNRWKVIYTKKGAVEVEYEIEGYGVFLKEPSLEVESVSSATLMM